MGEVGGGQVADALVGVGPIVDVCSSAALPLMDVDVSLPPRSPSRSFHSCPSSRHVALDSDQDEDAHSFVSEPSSIRRVVGEEEG